LFAKQKKKELGLQIRLFDSLVPREAGAGAVAEAAGETEGAIAGVPPELCDRAD
jgi:hypothetical protein